MEKIEYPNTVAEWFAEHIETDYYRAAMLTLKNLISRFPTDNLGRLTALRELYRRREEEMRALSNSGYIWSELQAEPDIAYVYLVKQNPQPREMQMVRQQVLSLEYISKEIEAEVSKEEAYRETREAYETVLNTDGFTRDSLKSEEAMKLWRKLYAAEYIDENCKSKLHRTESAFMAQALTIKLNIKPLWKEFENHWGYNDLRTGIGVNDKSGKLKKFVDSLGEILK